MINFDKQYKKSGIPWIGDVPVDWEATKLKNIAKLVNGYAFKSDLYSKNGVFIVRITNVDDEKLNTNSPVYYPFNRLKEFRGNLLKENDILMTLTGNVGLVGIVDKQYPKAALNQRVGCIRTKKVSNKFLFYLFATDVFRKHAILNADGTAQLNLSTDWLMSNKLFVPQLSKQQQIVNYLDKKVGIIDKLIENINQQIEELKNGKNSIVREYLKQKLEGHTVRVQDVADMKKGPFGSSLKKEMFVQESEESFKVYEQQHAIESSSTIGEYYINKSKYIELYGFSVKPKDIIISCAGTIGKLFVLPQRIKPGIINQALMRVRVKDWKITNAFFSYIWNFIIMDEVVKYCNGSAIKNIPPFSILNKIKFILPSLASQEHITAILDDKTKFFDKLIQIKRQKIMELKEYKKSLIYECVTGKKEVL